MIKPIKKIAVIGDGGWGTTLAIHLANKNQNVTLWGPFPEYIEEIRLKRINTKFLPGIPLPGSIELSSNLETTIQSSDLIIIAVPSKYLDTTCRLIKNLNLKISDKIFLSVTKGVDTKTLRRMSEIIRHEIKPKHLAVLSGPTIAKEVAQGIPTTAVIASPDIKIATKLQSIFNSDTFRIYTNTDVIGVELGGAIKNVIALACGVCDGLGFGTNAKAAILTRGLAEMARLGHAMGAKKETFYGLTGLGDLVTTCVNASSRNRTVGEAIGKGGNIKKILSSMEMVAEGVETAPAVYKLSRRYKIPMPISEQVYNVLYKGKNPRRAVSDLMGRKTKSE